MRVPYATAAQKQGWHQEQDKQDENGKQQVIVENGV